MAAIQRNRISPSVAGAFAVAISAALLVGGTGGYVVRSLTSQLAAPAQPAVTQPSLGNEDLAQSDLTRAQPASATVPDWVQNYMAQATSQQFKVDEMLENLSYAGTVASGEPTAGPLELTR
ncbi:MAG TPA: hypothetical protein VKE27_12350 [Candidatus Dormibacteraeota bacterium]|nr:hypothetical protein [Candidatus Dormibacteraeota bacterium]